jgi:small subunit ribosomal protein S2
MKELPSAVFVIDPKTDIEVIRESKRLNIPVISIVDSDYSYELIDYPIPGNNNSILSIYFLLSIVLQALK